MPRGRSRRRALLASAAALLAVGVWVIALTLVRRAPDPARSPAARDTAPSPAASAPPARKPLASLHGVVREVPGGAPIGHARVTLRAPATELTATTADDGTFSLEVPPARYQVLVEAPGHIVVAPAVRPRLPGAPRAELAGALDAALIPVLDVTGDARGIELDMVRAATIVARMIDGDGRPLRRAVVRARGAYRPVLGTDVAISDEHGRAILRVAPGDHAIDATHASHAGLSYERVVQVSAGAMHEISGYMARGCVLAGRVVDARGEPAVDGAIERLVGRGEFAPAGRVDADGTFRWVTTRSGDVTVRAWPWRSPPSPPRTLTCEEGTRLTDLVLQLGDARPDLQGTLVDARGEPVPFAHLDISPLDVDAPGQQERTDAAGDWRVHRLPAGRYMVAAHAAGGIVHELVTAPARDLSLALGGTGRIEGSVTGLSDGSFVLAEMACADISGTVLELPARIVPVRDGRFAISDVPACRFVGVASWREQRARLLATVTPGGVTAIELELGPARERRVRGVVRDAARRPVEGALVTATSPGGASESVRTDAAGRFTLSTQPGAELSASARSQRAHRQVGRANVDEEIVDLVLSIE